MAVHVQVPRNAVGSVLPAPEEDDEHATAIVTAATPAKPDLRKR
jgi:hypothetical protein